MTKYKTTLTATLLETLVTSVDKIPAPEDIEDKLHLAVLQAVKLRFQKKLLKHFTGTCTMSFEPHEALALAMLKDYFPADDTYTGSHLLQINNQVIKLYT